MKKFFGYCSAAAMALAFNVTLPTPVAAKSGKRADQICKMLVSMQIRPFAGAEPFETVGECMSHGNQVGDSRYVCYTLDQLPGGLQAAGFENFGHCVSELR